MSRGPNRYMSTHSLGMRLRRLRADSEPRVLAKLAFKEGRTLDAIKLLHSNGDVTEAHVESHVRWLNEQVPASVEDLV